MSDNSSNRAPLVAIIGIFALFALFLGVIYFVYLPRHTGAFTDDGIHNAKQRKDNLKALRDKEAAQARDYAWVDQKAGVVRLPLERAMELTLREAAAKQQIRTIRDLPESPSAKP
jgi:hypothetical protein